MQSTRDNGKDLHKYFQRQQAASSRIHAIRDKVGMLRTQSDDICRILNKRFESVFTTETTGELPEFDARNATRLDPVPNKLFNEIFRVELIALTADKASGPDVPHIRVLKECTDSLAPKARLD